MRFGDALVWVEAPTEPAALRRSLPLHPVGECTDGGRQLVVLFTWDAYSDNAGPHDYTPAVFRGGARSRRQSPSRGTSRGREWQSNPITDADRGMNGTTSQNSHPHCAGDIAMRTVVLASIVAIAFSIGLSTPALACSPLVVFYAGFGSQKGGNLLWKLCKGYKKHGARIRCLTWTDDEIDHIIDHWNSTDEPTPVVLIGHSYGGDTAYKVADRLPKIIEPTLITLDPVGEDAWITIGIPVLVGISFREERFPKPTQGVWVNVHKRAADFTSWIGGSVQFGGPGSCESIADEGGLWGKQRNAKSIPFEGSHCDVRKMFKLAEYAVDNATICLSE